MSPECRAPRRAETPQASGTAGRTRSAWQRGARRRRLAAGDGEAGERGVLRNPGPRVRRLRTAVDGLLFESLKGQVERVAQRVVVLEWVPSQLSSRMLEGRAGAFRVRGPRRRGRPAPRASRPSGRVTRAWSRLGLLRRGHRRRAAAHANLGRCPWARPLRVITTNSCCRGRLVGSGVVRLAPHNCRSASCSRSKIRKTLEGTPMVRSIRLGPQPPDRPPWSALSE